MNAARERVIFLAIVTLLIVGYVAAKSPLESDVASTRKTTEALELPVPESLAAAALNFRTFAADIAWVRSLVGRGEDVRKKRANGFYVSNGHSLTGVDPFFRRAYDFFPAVALQARQNVKHDTLFEIADYYDRGIDTFPTDPNLTFDAGLLFVGYSAKHSPEDRAKQTKRALSYFKRTAELPGANSLTPGLISFFTRRAKTESTDGKEAWGLEDKDLLLQLYLQTPDPSFRQYIGGELAKLGVDATNFKQAAEKRRTTIEEMKRQNGVLFLDDGMFWTVAE